MKYIKVALNLPLNQSFSYKVPSELSLRVKIGTRVIVPFGRRILGGFVVGEIKRGEGGSRLREIIRVLDDFLLGDNFLKLGRWISEYYYCSLGQALHSIFPIEQTFKIGKGKKKDKELPANGAFRKLGVRGKWSEATLPAIRYPLYARKRVRGKEVFLFRAEGREKRAPFYLSLIKEVLKEKKQIILIVPEISYIPLLQELISSYYEGEIAIIHSRLSPKKRYEEWCKIERGQAPLTIGTRSAIFAPCPRLGLIIIEEEENSAYKQIEAPRYHLREVAVKRAEIEGFPVVLFTGSPSLESWYRAKNGIYKSVEFSQSKKNSPEVEIVDMRTEKDRLFSSSLEREIRKNLQENNPTLLFLNRRGFANFLLCLECGRVPRCPNCNIGLTFHLKGKLICHYCAYEERAPRICPSCKGSYFRQAGLGTERLEMEARKRFSNASIRRGDLDAAGSPSLYKKLRADFLEKKIDILVGTQLVIREEILRHMSLVGVVLADGLLNLPDFRAGEYLFQLLLKIKRLMKQEGKLVIQTYNPTHYALEAAAREEEDFYQKESEIRKDLGYPPYLHWARILLEGKTKTKVEEAAEILRERLDGERIEFLGPSPCPFGKIKGEYRYHLVLKDDNPSLIRQVLEKLDPLLSGVRGVKRTVDVDPLRTM